MTKTENIVGSSITGASYLLSLQIFTRLTTFIINQLLFRFVSSDIFGVASIDLELLLSTILFLSREGFRCALLRSNILKNNPINPEKSEKSEELENETLEARQKFINLCYLPIPIGFILAFIMFLFNNFKPSSQTNDNMTYYNVSFFLYLLAALIELIIEPLYIISYNQLNFKLRTKLEGSAVFLRCVSQFLINLFLNLMFEEDKAKTYSIISFGVAQLIYSLTLFCGYLKHFLKEKVSFLPKSIVVSGTSKVYYFDSNLLNLSFTLSLQSLIKHFLTEGDKLLLALLSDNNEKGYYSSAANYGSLVARIIFQPLEESSRVLFSKLLKSNDSKQDENNNNERPEDASVSLAAKILVTTLKFQILFGMIFLFFVPNYTSTLYSLMGSKWNSSLASTILSIYCLYIPIMGINGITEAFVQAVAQPKQLNQLSFAMSIFTAIFLLVGFGLNQILPKISYSIILANCVNMLLRIFWSIRFIINYFNGLKSNKGASKSYFQLNKILISKYVLFSFILSFIICLYSSIHIGHHTILDKLLHIGVGALTFGITSIIIFIKEKAFINEIRGLIKSKRS